MPPKKKSLNVPLARVAKPAGEHDIGEALVASRMIPAGSRILLEKAALVFKADFLLLAQSQAVEDRLKVEFDELDDPTKARVNALTNNFPSKNIGDFGEPVYIDTHYSGILKSNAIPLSPDPSNVMSDCVGIFPVFLCKVNHSCHPNAMQSFNSNLNVCTLHAIEDIYPGEQITISYVPECKIDRKYLWKHYRINCYCNWCRKMDKDRLDEEQIQSVLESNENREIIKRKLRTLTEHARRADELDEQRLGAAFRIGRGLVSMVAHIESISDYRLGLLYFNMLLLAIADKGSSYGSIEILAALAWDAYRTCEGTDSPKIAEITKIMQKNVLQIPRGAPRMTALDWHEQINQTLIDLIQEYEDHEEAGVLGEMYREEIWPEEEDLLDDPFEEEDLDSDGEDNTHDPQPRLGELMVTEWNWFTKDVDSQAGDTTDEDEPSSKEKAKLDGFVVSDDDSNNSNSEWGSGDEEALLALSAKKKKLMRKKAKKEGQPIRGRGRPRGGRATITGRGRGRGRGRGGGRGRGTPRGRTSLGRGRGTPSNTSSGLPRGRQGNDASNQAAGDIQAAADANTLDGAVSANDVEVGDEVTATGDVEVTGNNQAAEAAQDAEYSHDAGDIQTDERFEDADADDAMVIED